MLQIGTVKSLWAHCIFWIEYQNIANQAIVNNVNDIFVWLGCSWTRTIIFSILSYGTVSFYSGINKTTNIVPNRSRNNTIIITKMLHIIFLIGIKRILLIELNSERFKNPVEQAVKQYKALDNNLKLNV